MHQSPTPQYEDKPCWHCVSWDGWAWGGPHSYCANDKCPRVHAVPAQGCCSWERAPGVDDEAGPPPMPGLEPV